jgi:hypothetical protein
VQFLIDAGEIGDAGAVQVEGVHTLQEGVAGAPGQQGGLALIELDPDIVLGLGIALPALVDCPVGACARGRALRKAVSAHAGQNEPLS